MHDILAPGRPAGPYLAWAAGSSTVCRLQPQRPGRLRSIVRVVGDRAEVLGTGAVGRAVREAGERAADQLGLGAAEEIAERRVQVLQDTIEAEQGDALRCVLKQSLSPVPGGQRRQLAGNADNFGR